MTVQNDGFAPMYESRPVRLLLRDRATGALTELKVNTDPRGWRPGKAKTINTRLRLPADLAKGTYDLLLALADAAKILQAEPAFAVQYANSATWEAQTGYNKFFCLHR